MDANRVPSSAGVKQRFYRMGVFFLAVVVTSAAAGILIAQLGLPKPQARAYAMPATVACLALSYALAYKPGWMYNYLVEDR